MKTAAWIASAAVLLLVGCSKPPVDSPSVHHGRYVGIGIYAPGNLWQRMTQAAPQTGASPDAARLSDDDQVIVVVDSDTGEIRQCGNLSGYCVGMNPWAKALTSQQQAPLNLTAHALKLPPIEPAPAASAPVEATPSAKTP